MLAHRRALIIPRLSGRDNYKEWSQKVELHMRIHELWPAVLDPPEPIKCAIEQDDFIFVASRKHVYMQCPESLIRKTKLFLFRFIEPTVITQEYLEMSVPRIWRELKRKFGHLKSEPKKKLTKSKKIKLVKDNRFGL